MVPTNLITLQFERTGDMQCLDDAVKYECSVLAATKSGDMKRPRRLNALGNMLSRKFHYTGKSEYLDEAIERLHEAVLTTRPHSKIEKATYLVNLARTLLAEFQRRGELEDLRTAVDKTKEALALEGKPADRITYLDCLASCLRLLYEETQEPNTLEEALRFGIEARALTKNADHFFRLTSANNLAIIHTRLFERFILLRPSIYFQKQTACSHQMTLTGLFHLLT